MNRRATGKGPAEEGKEEGRERRRTDGFPTAWEERERRAKLPAGTRQGLGSRDWQGERTFPRQSLQSLSPPSVRGTTRSRHSLAPLALNLPFFGSPPAEPLHSPSTPASLPWQQWCSRRPSPSFPWAPPRRRSSRRGTGSSGRGRRRRRCRRGFVRLFHCR